MRARDQGSVTLFAVVLAFGLLVAIGLAVDGAGKVRAIQQADHAAAEAARAAGQEIQVPGAVRGRAPELDRPAAAAAAAAYLQDAGVQGTVSVSGDVVRVATRTSYAPVFLPLIGMDRLDVTGEASARVVRGVSGEEP